MAQDEPTFVNTTRRAMESSDIVRSAKQAQDLLASLPDEQRAEIMSEYAREVLKLQNDSLRSTKDLRDLDRLLDTLVEKSGNAARQGVSLQTETESKGSFGRTTITATGRSKEDALRLYIVVGVVLVVIVILALVAMHK